MCAVGYHDGNLWVFRFTGRHSRNERGETSQVLQGTTTPSHRTLRVNYLHCQSKIITFRRQIPSPIVTSSEAWFDNSFGKGALQKKYPMQGYKQERRVPTNMSSRQKINLRSKLSLMLIDTNLYNKPRTTVLPWPAHQSRSGSDAALRRSAFDKNLPK